MPNRFVNGFRVDEFGTLQTSAGPIASWQQGLPFDAAGALVVTPDVPVASDAYVGTIRVSPTKGVYITTVVPGAVFGFSNGFSDGFQASEATIPPPVNTVAPVVTGVPQSSNTLTCSPGTWIDADAITFQWMAHNTPIIGKTGNTLTLNSTYIGDEIFCSVSATNEAGASTVSSNVVTVLP